MTSDDLLIASLIRYASTRCSTCPRSRVHGAPPRGSSVRARNATRPPSPTLSSSSNPSNSSRLETPSKVALVTALARRRGSAGAARADGFRRLGQRAARCHRPHGGLKRSVRDGARTNRHVLRDTYSKRDTSHDRDHYTHPQGRFPITTLYNEIKDSIKRL